MKRGERIEQASITSRERDTAIKCYIQLKLQAH